MTATAVRERPIIFSAPMVRAILSGAKTQTRRIVRGTINESPDEWRFDRMQPYADGFVRAVFDDLPSGEPNAIGRLCPHGQPGDRLWVRETFAPSEGGPIYREWPQFDDCAPSDIDWRWHSPIHMPRWASRITLEITDVRVERLQDISEEDVLAEGVNVPRCPNCGYSRWDACFHLDHALCGHPEPDTGIPVFRSGWDALNRKRGLGWNVNPWVWAVSFRGVA